MKKILFNIASVFIVNESIVCWHYGSFSVDSSLITYASVYCTEFPLSEKSLQCLEDSGEVKLLEDLDI